MPSPIVHWQILSTDPAAHAEFYRSVFDWNINGDNPLGYRTAETGSGGPSGGFWPSPPGSSPFVQLFVEVPEMKGAIARAVRAGGTVVVPPQTLPQGDQMAVLRDPQGLSVGLMVPAARK